MTPTGNEQNVAPFTREEIADEVRRVAVAMASLVAHFGGDAALDQASAYLGVELESYDLGTCTDEELQQIPIESHYLHTVVMAAYDYAYQVGERGRDGPHLRDQHQDVDSILVAMPRADWQAEPSPLDPNNPSKLRQVLETFLARLHLDSGEALTIRQLALLANMTEPAVRTSLSSAGIKTIPPSKKGELSSVAHADALRWLMGRRGFIPSAPNEVLADHVADGRDFLHMEFVPALEKAMAAMGLSVTNLAENAGVPLEWLKALLNADSSVDLAFAALEQVAKALSVPVPLFIGRAVTEILSRREAIGTS